MFLLYLLFIKVVIRKASFSNLWKRMHSPTVNIRLSSWNPAEESKEGLYEPESSRHKKLHRIS